MDNHNIKSTVRSAALRFEQAGILTAQLDAEILLAYVLNKSRTWLYTYPHFQPPKKQLITFRQLVVRREQREPVAYIIGQKAFYGLDFLVTPDVLIPRPETELLVEQALEIIRQQDSGRSLNLVDVGTGSGCIAIALAHHLKTVQITAVDLSDAALRVAKENAINHEVQSGICFKKSDLLTNIPGPIDVIVSNPPYIAQAVVHSPETMPEVRQFEPHLALNGGPSGLETIERLLAQAAQKLNRPGNLLVEIGFDQGPAVLQLARSRFPEAAIQILPDLAGLDRLLVVRTSV